MKGFNGLQEKSPLRLASEAALIGGFIVAAATRWNIADALIAAVGFGLLAGVIGLVYRGVTSR